MTDSHKPHKNRQEFAIKVICSANLYAANDRRLWTNSYFTHSHKRRISWFNNIRQLRFAKWTILRLYFYHNKCQRVNVIQLIADIHRRVEPFSETLMKKRQKKDDLPSWLFSSLTAAEQLGRKVEGKTRKENSAFEPATTIYQHHFLQTPVVPSFCSCSPAAVLDSAGSDCGQANQQIVACSVYTSYYGNHGAQWQNRYICFSLHLVSEKYFTQIPYCWSIIPLQGWSYTTPRSPPLNFRKFLRSISK